MAAISIIPKKLLSPGLRLDPEYYQPRYLALEKKLYSFCNKKVSELSTKSITPFDPSTTDKFRYIEISDVDMSSGEVTSKEIDSSETPDRAKYLMEGGEILISTVRPNRSAIGLLPKELRGYVVSSGFAPLLSQDERYRAFLFIWFKLGLITDWLVRNTTASMYPAVSFDDVCSTPIFEPNDKLLSTISEYITNIESLSKKSRELLPLVDKELLSSTEFNRVDVHHILKYTVSSKSLVENRRIDAEFYQPKFSRLLKHLDELNSMRIDEFCPIIKRGVSPVYVDSGEVVLVNSQDLGANGIIDSQNLERTDIDFYSDAKNSDARLEKFDVLVYATGAYIGRTNCWLEDEKAMAGVDVLILQPDKKICDPMYLALFLNSPMGLMQADQRASGSGQRHLYPHDLSSYKVFIPKDKKGNPDLVWQSRLANKVIEAYNAEKEAKQKIRNAINLVEKEIEKQITRAKN